MHIQWRMMKTWSWRSQQRRNLQHAWSPWHQKGQPTETRRKKVHQKEHQKQQQAFYLPLLFSPNPTEKTTSQKEIDMDRDFGSSPHQLYQAPEIQNNRIGSLRSCRNARELSQCFGRIFQPLYLWDNPAHALTFKESLWYLLSLRILKLEILCTYPYIIFFSFLL